MSMSGSKRRLQKRASELKILFASHPDNFYRVWTTLYKSWIDEVHFRLQAQRRDSSLESIPAIFGVLTHARSLARAADVLADPKVADSLVQLQHICAKAVALVTDPKLYRFDKDCSARMRERFVRYRVRD